MVVTGDRCNGRLSLSVLKRFALLIGFACCVSRPDACGGLWTGQMLFVCSTCGSVMYVLCFVRFAENVGIKSQKRPCCNKNMTA